MAHHCVDGNPICPCPLSLVALQPTWRRKITVHSGRTHCVCTAHFHRRAVVPDLEFLRKLHLVTDLTLLAAKNEEHGQSSGAIHLHLWFTLTDMRDADKSQQPDAPVSPEGIF